MSSRFSRFIALLLFACTVSAWLAAPSRAETATQTPDTLDVDANGSVDALTDGILIVRYLFGLRGQALIQNAIGPGATRTAAADIEAYLEGNSALDVDDNGKIDALTDGILIMRYLFGLQGQSLVQGAIGTGAVRNTSTLVSNYLAGLYTLPGNCSINASPPSSAASPLPPGTQVQLTANCGVGPGPITYMWSTGAGTSGIVVSPQTTTTYTVTPSNANGSGASLGATVTIGVVSNCNITQSPNTVGNAVPVGSTVTLSVSCSGNAPSSCSWDNGVTSTFCTVDIQAPFSTTTYTATPTGGSGAGIAVSTTVNVIPSAQGAQDFCGSGDAITYVGWPADGQIKLSSNGFNSGRLAYQIVVPTTFQPPLDNTHLGFFNVYETPGSTTTSREVTLSKNACDFQTGNYLYSDIGAGDTAPHITFTAENPNGYQQAGGVLNLNPGDVIYVNVRNQDKGQSTCPFSSCDITFEFATPNRF